MAASMSAAPATPRARASTATLTSMATVRVTISPGVSSMTWTASPAACRRPTASARAAGGQPSEAATATAVAAASSRVRSTTTTGAPSRAACSVASVPSQRISRAPPGSSTAPARTADPPAGGDRHAGPLEKRAEPRLAVLHDLRRRRRGRGRRRFLRRTVSAVVVHAPARLASQPAALDEGALGEGGLEAGVVAEGGPDLPGDGLVDVVADEVHEGERAHPEAAGAGEDGVDGGGVSGALLEDAPRLAVERPGHPVDDEARGRRGPRDGLAPRRRQGAGPVGDLGAGRQPGDDLDEAHGRDGVEEVKADEPLGLAQPGGQRRRRQRRGVGGEDAPVADDRLEGGEQVALHRQVLDDRLDHHR